MIRIGPNGLHLIESEEGWVPHPYFDTIGRVWTRGFGETDGIGPHSPTITRAEGEANLRRIFEEKYAWAIRQLGTINEQNKFDALASFVWNLGAGIFTGSLREALEKREWGRAAQEMLSYDHSGGVVISDLQRRRENEVHLFLKAAPAPYVPSDERRWIDEWDHLRGNKSIAAHRRRLALKAAMTKRRKSIYFAATHEKHGWQVANRYHRYQTLKRYTK